MSVVILVIVKTYRIVEAMVNTRSDCVNWKGRNKQTPLHSTCNRVCSRNEMIATLLLRKGGDMSIEDENGDKPIQLAVKKQNEGYVCNALRYYLTVLNLQSSQSFFGA